jgi:hypothetical protein
MADAPSRTQWHLTGHEVATCNCAWGCPCQFNALPTHRRCEALVAARIREGRYGSVRLDGLAFAAAWWWPGAIHATPEQRTALLNILTAKDGGMPFEIFVSTVTTLLEPMFVPIRLDIDVESRRSRLEVPGLGEFETGPITNPMTGEEHRARIQLPTGFEYKVAEMGNTIRMRATLGDKTLDHQNSYAQLNAFEWSN